VLFSPLWGRFPALDWVCAVSYRFTNAGSVSPVPNEPRRHLGEGHDDAEKMLVAGRHDKGLTLEMEKKRNK